MAEITIYTDGACKGNPGRGGWCAILICGDYSRTISGGFRRTTNNRMELTAVAEALRAVRRPASRIRIVSDSKSVFVEPFNSGKAAQRVKSGTQTNLDIWREILRLASLHSVTVEWTRGHDGNEYNEICDKIAVACCTDPAYEDLADETYESQNPMPGQNPAEDRSNEVLDSFLFDVVQTLGRSAADSVSEILRIQRLKVVPE